MSSKSCQEGPENTDSLFTGYATAMREDVKAFSVPILTLVSTERLTFAKVAGVLLAHEGYSAVFFPQRSF
jgi:hypothetical protein